MGTATRIAYPSESDVTSIARSTLSLVFLASNSKRRGASIVNDSNGRLFVKLGSVASPSDYTVKLNPHAFWELNDPAYTGPISGVWSSVGSGFARITEIANA